MSGTQDVIGGLDLSADDYVIKQSLVRSKYAVTDGDGNPVLKGKKKRFKIKEEFPFTNPQGDVVFRIKARNILDVAGNYELVDEESGEPFAVIEKEYTLFKHVYNIRDPDGRMLARIESESAVVMALKSFSDIVSILPHSYSITGPDGEHIGSISERLSLRDIFDVHVGDTGDAPREAIVAAAITIDALEED
ncbi:LURP-one-related/scramblase family protein [Halomarina litorea]|uniref:LURP-one-related/scramblase family protein n=1 Tax=Halomarina litorea TaxID=2961595 RepID=UPI0020C22C95|nr:hypothetical protein [Halomarina sp. BCD28]